MRMRSTFAGAALALAAGAVNSAPVLGVTGPVSATTPAFAGGGGALVQITLPTLTNVAISADYLCSSCSGVAFLMTDFGPNAGLDDLVLAASIDGSSSVIFSAASLAAGDYYLFLAGSTGAFAWRSSTAPVVSAVQNAAVGASLVTAGFNATVPYQSSFVPLAGQTLLFEITGTVSSTPPGTVPEPGTLTLMLVALLSAAGASHRSSGRTPPRNDLGT